ncbi:GntR family transcriptional regulator [Wenzhouxiangella sediminis]|uniref:GntR family transcriptional regulator n=1 Tax=Wenzhouxiangella sediminis TaxID=1792836 RepID=A0A3E1KB58_9GAMM|nr:GntR family transcriptional regulator [Wenzhouxiangella sediminis]RFF31729.1 GntR family transcriptional regulator [Wenzhouxiangella sediminis]
MVNVQAPALAVDVDSDVPIVQQIVNGLRRLLVSGELSPGNALPSSRALARDLGVHFNTVAQAYRTLEAEGWLALKRRAGTVVLERSTPELDARHAEALARQFTEELRNLRARYEALGVERRALDASIEAMIDDRRNSS